MLGIRIGGPHAFGCDCFVCAERWRASRRFRDLLLMKLNSRAIYPFDSNTRVTVTARGVKMERLQWIEEKPHAR